MLIAYDETGQLISVTSYRDNNAVTDEMVDTLHPPEQGLYLRIYDVEVMKKVWVAQETNGSIHLVMSDTGEVITIETSVGSFVPEAQPPDTTYEDYLLDLDFRLSMIELGL